MHRQGLDVDQPLRGLRQGEKADVIAQHALRRSAFLRSELDRTDVADTSSLRDVCARELEAIERSFRLHPRGL